MKLSVSLSPDDVEFLDRIAEELDLSSRSAALQRAVAALRESRLETAYEAAIDEWTGSPDAAAWETAAGDGIR